MENKNKGKFITFEGTEGCGKTTQCKLLFDYLTACGKDVILTREIGGTREAEEIRSLIVNLELYTVSELLLVMAARFEHINKVILPALAAGKWVICDRFIDSTACYQGQSASIGLEKVYKLHQDLISPLLPDITFFIDQPLEISLKRALSRTGNNKFEEKDIDFHQRVQEGFYKLCDSFKERIIKIDAENLSPEEIHQKIISYLIL